TRVLQIGGARHHGRKMPHAGDVIAEEQTPAADALEPVVDLLIAFLGEVKVTAVLVDQLEAVHSSQEIADRDASQASQESHAEREYRIELSFENQVSGEDQQCFIGDRQPDDA